MIQDVRGDILLSKADLIAHGVAPNDDFHQGLALALRDRWPGMYKDFRHYCHVSHPEVGTIWTWAGPGIHLAALFTQDAAYGHGAKPGKAHRSAVNHALRELHKFAEKEQVRSIAVPRIATGVGGLEWDDVRPLIEEHLGRLDLPVYVYSSYVPGEAPSIAGA